MQKKAAEQVYNLFIAEMKEVEDTFENSYKKRPVMPISHPDKGGMAIYIHSLICRIDRAKYAIDSMYFVPNHDAAVESEAKYRKLKESLDNFISQGLFKEWTTNIEGYSDEVSTDNFLKKNILVQTTQQMLNEQSPFIQKNTLFASSRKVGLLEANFEKKLLMIMIETQYWTKVSQHGFVSLNINLVKLHTRREQLRILMENVMIIVRDYNNIMNLINDKEKSLFKEHLA